MMDSFCLIFVTGVRSLTGALTVFHEPQDHDLAKVRHPVALGYRRSAKRTTAGTITGLTPSVESLHPPGRPEAPLYQ